MASPMIHAAVPADLADWVTGRAALRCEPTRLARSVMSELWMWQAVQRVELSRQTWTLDELQLIAASTMGAAPSAAVPTTMGHMAAALYDARRVGDVADDEATAAVLERLAGLSAAADVALEYAVARWWAEGLPHSVDGWAEVGVRATDGRGDL